MGVMEAPATPLAATVASVSKLGAQDPGAREDSVLAAADSIAVRERSEMMLEFRSTPSSNFTAKQDIMKMYDMYNTAQGHGCSQDFFREGGGTFRNFVKHFLRKLRKCIILAYFSKKLSNNALKFCAFGRKCKLLGTFERILKICNENSIEKLNFYFIFILSLENLLLKKNLRKYVTPFFYNIFSVSGGGEFPPWLRRCSRLKGVLMFKAFRGRTALFCHY